MRRNLLRRRWPLLALLLIAALTPVVIFGSARLRTSPPSPDVAPDPARPAPAPAARPQLAHSTSSLDVAPVRDAEEESPAPSASSKTAAPEEPPGGGYLAGAGAALKSGLGMVVGAPEPPVQDPVPARQPEPTAGLGASAPLPGPSAASATGASGPLALVQFIGLTQDQQALERNDFAVQTLREVKINVWWNVVGTQTQRLELFAPDGTLYRRVSATFDANALPRTQGRVLVQTSLPVGGTWITEYSLFGAWRVDVYLAGQSSPVTTASFILNP
ncbi:MAG TPA: hypothetical protein VID04_02045 [Methylomirabilota bacterium]|jgi:hypothetical protein